MKNFLKGIGVGIAFAFAWTYFYFYSGLGLPFSLIGKLSDFDRGTLIAVRIYKLVLYWSVVGLLFVLAFWLTRTRKAKARGKE
jgi:glucan phosphoethanolaminetransferase (alkaline phosphatase superfamily)